MVYLIIKAGVYRHDIAGCFSDPERAKEEAKNLADTCVDSHHKYCVQPMLMEKILDRKMDWSGHIFDEPEEIASYSKET